MSVKYNIYSLTEEEPELNVGIFLFDQAPGGQPVRLAVDLVEWTASSPVTLGSPVLLGVSGSYSFTQMLGDQVYATNDPSQLHPWWFRPCNCGDDTYTIAVSPSPDAYVWTAEAPGAPIVIAPFQPGEFSQVFKVVSVPQSRTRRAGA